MSSNVNVRRKRNIVRASDQIIISRTELENLKARIARNTANIEDVATQATENCNITRSLVQTLNKKIDFDAKITEKILSKLVNREERNSTSKATVIKQQATHELSD